MKWIARDRRGTAQPSEVQRFCLVVGLLLRDLSLSAAADSTSIWPDHVPGYMAVSQIEAAEREVVLAACSSAFFDTSTTSAVPQGRVGNGKGKGKRDGGVHANEERPSGSSDARAPDVHAAAGCTTRSRGRWS